MSRAYRVTVKGSVHRVVHVEDGVCTSLELLPILLALGSWGNRWLAPEGELIVPVDAATGARIDPIVVDRHTKKPLGSRRVALTAGKGASAELQTALAEPLPIVELPS